MVDQLKQEATAREAAVQAVTRELETANALLHPAADLRAVSETAGAAAQLQLSGRRISDIVRDRAHGQRGSRSH